MFTCFGGEDPETIIPKTTCYKEPTVNSSDETVASDFQLLTEIVSKVST